jgi:transcriptional regulator with XRE-family HTH domain
MTAQELKEWRQGLGWTQQQAADALDIWTPHYRALESGRQPIRHVYALACNWLSWENSNTKKVLETL